MLADYNTAIKKYNGLSAEAQKTSKLKENADKLLSDRQEYLDKYKEDLDTILENEENIYDAERTNAAIRLQSIVDYLDIYKKLNDARYEAVELEKLLLTLNQSNT